MLCVCLSVCKEYRTCLQSSATVFLMPDSAISLPFIPIPCKKTVMAMVHNVWEDGLYTVHERLYGVHFTWIV